MRIPIQYRRIPESDTLSTMSIPSRTRGKTAIRAEISPFSRQIMLPMQGFLYAEQAGGIMMIVGAAIGLIWANSLWAGTYHHIMEQMLTIDLHVLVLSLTVHHWINDGLMTLFFLAVGLEIKHEMVHGSLSTIRQAALPVLAAAGGMIVPAFIYFLFTRGTPASHGWGVPVATDIAFALGVLSLLGNRVPLSAKVFLLAFATVDDILGIIVIAVFYAGQISWIALGICAALIIAMVVLRRNPVRDPGIYALLGVLLWVAMLKSGVHAAIAGVILGLLAPAHGYYDAKVFTQLAEKLTDKLRHAIDRNDADETGQLLGQMEELARNTEEPLNWLVRLIRPWVSYIVLPVFALANSGVELTGEQMRQAIVSPVTLGIFVGLLLGKFVGIGLFTWGAIKLKIGVMPPRARVHDLIGVSILAGIGFTVSLFIANLGFSDAVHVADAKIGILAASAVAALAGYFFLLSGRPVDKVAEVSAE
jgi:NhaA family Na+:H+ antiporter